MPTINAYAGIAGHKKKAERLMELLSTLRSVLIAPFRLAGWGARFLVGPWFELWLVKSYQVQLLTSLSSAHAMMHELRHMNEKSLEANRSLRTALQSFEKRLSSYIAEHKGAPDGLIDSVKTLQSELRSVIDDAEKNGS